MLSPENDRIKNAAQIPQLASEPRNGVTRRAARSKRRVTKLGGGSFPPFGLNSGRAQRSHVDERAFVLRRNAESGGCIVSEFAHRIPSRWLLRLRQTVWRGCADQPSRSGTTQEGGRIRSTIHEGT